MGETGSSEVPLEIIAAKPKQGSRLIARGEAVTGSTDMEVDRNAIREHVSSTMPDSTPEQRAEAFQDLYDMARYGNERGPIQ